MGKTSGKTKVIVTVSAVALVLIVAFTVCLALYIQGANLSYEFDDFMSRHDIDVPEGFSDEAAKEFYELTIKQLEEHPYRVFVYGWMNNEVFASRIQMAYLQDRNFVIPSSVRSSYEMFEEMYAEQHK